MRLHSKLLKAVLFAATLGAAGAVQAQTPPVNYSDHWQNSSQPGWAFSITQNGDVLFGVLYIYEQGFPAWYSGTLRFVSEGPSGVRTYSAPLYRTTGPAGGPSYDPSLVKYTQVGTISVEFGDDAHGILSYSINGVAVVSAIQHFTFAPNSVTGSYIGATSDVTYDCADPTRNGIVTTDPGFFTIAIESGKMVMRFPTCTNDGTYTQQGQVGTFGHLLLHARRQRHDQVHRPALRKGRHRGQLHGA